MAVLVEAISVIVRKDAIDKKYPGGLEAFYSQATNATFCEDDELVRVGFMSPDDVGAYIGNLEGHGLLFEYGGKAQEIAVVDQSRGSTITCDWLEFAEVKYGDNGKISACWFYEGRRLPGALHLSGKSPAINISLPAGWEYEGSLSQKTIFVPNEDFSKRLKYLRTEDNVDVYLDLSTGKEVYESRPSVPPDSEASAHTLLEMMARDVLELGERAEATTDAKEISVIHDRLLNDLLPQAEKLAAGVGSRMSLSYTVLGLIHSRLDEYETAETMYHQSLSIKPGNPLVLMELTFCLSMQKKWSQALFYAKRFVEVEPEDATGWINLASCHTQCGNRKEAADAIEKLVILDPQDQRIGNIKADFHNCFD